MSCNSSVVSAVPPLYIVAPIVNPCRYQSRYKLYRDFAHRVESAGAKLITVECAFGDRPFEVTERNNHMHLQLRSWDEIWLKENMINLGIEYLSQIDPSWEYVAWVDADVTFARPDWVTETVHQLQHHHFVQMFSQAHDLGPNNEIFGTYESFVSCYKRQLLQGPIDDVPGKYMTGWHPGYAWAARREALDFVGGLYDTAVLGSGDQHMARALIGRGRDSINPKMHKSYLRSVDRWERLAEKHVRRDIGLVDGALLHHWHGRKAARGYNDRWKILRDLQFDIVNDLKRSVMGLYQLVDHGDDRSIQIRDQIRGYFRSRNEDGTEL